MASAGERLDDGHPGPAPIIVGGMHRSGTSMMGGLLRQAGVHMGNDLIPADRANPRGYHEDREIVAFHGGMFRKLLPPGGPGHVDWGWSEAASLDEAGVDRFRQEARAIAERRMDHCARDGNRSWGFKDPRATLVLDFWDRCLADIPPRYVLLYRRPWQVADSMQRLGAEVFLRNPTYAYRMWSLYNERLLDFYLRHRERCLLVNIDALPAGLPRLCERLSSRVGLDVDPSDVAGAFDERLLTGSRLEDPLASLAAVAFPRCVELFNRLEDAADVPDGRKVDVATRPGTPLRGPGAGGPCEVTIVIPTRNDAVYLIEALASLERCRLSSAEVLVVNDGSTEPESTRILEGLRRRGHFILDLPHRGLSAARNAGISRGSGRYVLPLDADNRLRPGFIEAALETFRADPEVGVVYGDRQLFGGDTIRLVTPQFDLARIAHGNFIDACAVFRRDLWEDIGGYEESLPGLEDWEFWLHAGSRGWRFRHLDTIALDYRVRPGSLVTQCLSGPNWLRLTRQIRAKHVRSFRDLLPRPVRRLADVVGAVLPHRMRARWDGSVTAGYWRLAWTRHRIVERIEGVPRRLDRRLSGVRRLLGLPQAPRP